MIMLRKVTNFQHSVRIIRTKLSLDSQKDLITLQDTLNIVLTLQNALRDYRPAVYISVGPT